MIRLAVSVQGVVQGVGFRPFVYGAAMGRGLSGWVKNQADGLRIEIQGSEEEVRELVAMLARQPPPPARVERVQFWEMPAREEEVGFRILDSEADTAPRPAIPADLATCAECAEEIARPGERRYRYPFTNCTHCGPRYTLVEALPYDRARTAMKHFALCEACEAEYRDPSDRRFHAQPIACPACGPTLRLLSPGADRRRPPVLSHAEASTDQQAVNAQHEPTVEPAFSPAQASLDKPPPRAERGRGGWGEGEELLTRGDYALRRAAEAIRSGAVVALKGLGGFQLLVDATREEPVALLRSRKRREEKPFAVMFPSLESLGSVCALCSDEERLLLSPEAPIVLVRRLPSIASGSAIADGVAPRNPWLGVMLPYTPLHRLLMDEVGRPVVCTSGNLAEEPMCVEEQEAFSRLGDIADLYLVHDRPIVRPVDDSVVRVGPFGPQVLRRARGYAPLPLSFGEEESCLLALGGQLKNTIALALQGQVVVSQHLGDLSSAESALLLERCASDMLRFFDARPEVLACDLHPDYASTQLAERLSAQWGVPVERVQHHHAHVAACMAEHRLSGPVLGLAWDGAGLGTDGTLWGGEALVVEGAVFRRVAHLRPFSLPGAERAMREPRRAAMGLLYEIFGAEALAHVGNAVPASEARVFLGMLERRVNAPRTSSMGRLFDAVAFLTGIRNRVAFEGQAAMELEHAADGVGDSEAYPLPLSDGEPALADWEPLIRALLDDREQGTPAALISARFHEALAQLAEAIAMRVSLPRVVLSGGCFQNLRLTRLVRERLLARGLEVYAPALYPTNDGALSLGQVWVAACRRKEPRDVPRHSG